MRWRREAPQRPIVHRSGRACRIFPPQGSTFGNLLRRSGSEALRARPPATGSASLPHPLCTSLTRSVSGRSGLRCSHLPGLAMSARALLLPSAGRGLARREASPALRRGGGGRPLRRLHDEPASPCGKKAPPSPPPGGGGGRGPPALTTLRYGRRPPPPAD